MAFNIFTGNDTATQAPASNFNIFTGKGGSSAPVQTSNAPAPTTHNVLGGLFSTLDNVVKNVTSKPIPTVPTTSTKSAPFSVIQDPKIESIVNTITGKVPVPTQALGLPSKTDQFIGKNTNNVSIDGQKYLTNSGGGIISPFKDSAAAQNVIIGADSKSRQFSTDLKLLQEEGKTIDTSNPQAVKLFNAKVDALHTSGATLGDNLQQLDTQLKQYQGSEKASKAITDQKNNYGALGLTQEQQLEKGVTYALIGAGVLSGATELAGLGSIAAEGAAAAGGAPVAATKVVPLLTKELIQGGIGIGVFTGLQKAESGLLKNASDPIRGLVFAANLFAAGGVLAGISKAAPKLGDALFQSYTEKYNLPKTISFSPTDVTKNLASGELNDLTRLLFNEKGVLDKEKIKDAAKNGINIEIPAEKIVTLSEKPYWSKIKDFFGVEPEKLGDTTIKMGENRQSNAGLLPEGKTIEPIFSGKVETVPIEDTKPIDHEKQIANIVEDVKKNEPLLAVDRTINTPPIETKSQISSLSDTENKLINEAKKYSSPDEFIKSQQQLFHGTDKKFDSFKDGSFLSTKENFAKDYGTVKEPVYLDNKNTFDLTKKSDFDKLVSKTGPIDDPYDGNTYKTFKEYKNSDSFGHDTWEITEPNLETIKSLGFDSAKIFEGGIENHVTFNSENIKTKSQLNDIYNKAHGVENPIDENNNLVNNNEYGQNRSNNRENSQRTLNLSESSARSVQESSSGALEKDTARLRDSSRMVGEGDQRTVERTGEFTETRKERARVDLEALHRGESIKINEHTPLVLKAMGAPDAIVESIPTYFKKGAITHLSLIINQDSLGVYGSNLLRINREQFSDAIYKTGEILFHELDGHSFWEKLTPEGRESYYRAMQENHDLVKKAWKLSGNNHTFYAESSYKDIRREVFESILGDKVTEYDKQKASSKTMNILERIGFEFDPKISLDAFIKQTLSIEDVIDEANKELVLEGYRAIYMKPWDLTGNNEHFATISEKANSLKTKDTLLQQHLVETRNNTVNFKQNSNIVTRYHDIMMHRMANNYNEISTKILEKIKGRDTVSKQFIEDLTNSGDIKQVERDLIRAQLANEPNTINVPDFIEKVQANLLPLKVISSEDGEPIYEHVTLPEDVRGDVADYVEHVYESPVETSAGNVHFGGDEGSKHYFGHTRIEDMADENTRRVIEVQSDLYQKGNLEREEQKDLTNETREGDVQDFSQLKQYNNPSAHFRMVREEIKQAALDGKKELQFPTGETAMKVEGLGQLNNNFLIEDDSDYGARDLTQADLKVGRIIYQSSLEDYVTGNGDQAGWLITKILDDGKFQAVPKNKWDSMQGPERRLPNETEEQLRQRAYYNYGEQFDISGKVDKENPIYKFYEKELGRYLKNNYDAKEITDSNGVSWYQVPVYEDFGEKPIMAFRQPDMTPKELLAAAEEKGKQVGGQQDRINGLKEIVAKAKSYNDYMKMVTTDPAYKDNLPQLDKDVRDNGYQNLTDYYVKNKITSNNDQGIVPKRTYSVPKEKIPEPIKKAPEAIIPTQPENEINPKEKLELFKYVKDELRDRINQHPGKKLQKYMSLKEGDFEDFKNPDLAKTSSEKKSIEERNAKVIKAAEIAMDNDPSLSGMHDNPDVIREQIQKYKDLQQQYRNITQEERDFKTEIAKGKEELRTKQIQEIKAKAKKYKFTIPELDKNQSIDMADIVAQTELLKNHPAKPFFKYVNNRTGKLPALDEKNPGIYDQKMKALLSKTGFDSLDEAQKAVDNYRAHNELLTEMYNERFDPIEVAQANSVHKTPFSEAEKERLAAGPDDGAKSLDTIVNQDSIIKKGNDVMKKVAESDLYRTPDRVLTKIGLKAESDLIKKQYSGYLKELPKNIDKISAWAKRVPGKDSARKIFDYLDGKLLDEQGFQNPDVLTPEEKRVGDEIKSWLDEWADRLDLKPHERLTNYITHIFESDLISKEFDVDFAKIINDKVAGSVYDPFLEQRLGKLGYVHDAWRALDAYVKRATRKVYMDVALARVKNAAEELDLESYKYIKDYIDAINMRPTPRENRIDNNIKQMVGYRFGARPFSRISKALRQMVFRGTLGLNVSSALRNLSQSANTYAVLGEKNTIIGAVKLLSPENHAELSREGILGLDQIQDRTLSSTKKTLQNFDKGLFFLFETAERINRGIAYFGAKNEYYSKNSTLLTTEINGEKQKIRVYKDGASEEQAIEYGKNIVAKTQFTFSSVDTPLALRGDIMKTVLQFQSFNLKQTEFLIEMAKDKKYAGMIRWLAASIVFMYTVGKALGYKWQDMIPFYTIISGDYNLPPLLNAPYTIIKNAIGTKDKFGNPLTFKKRLNNDAQSFLPFVPGAVQGSKTISGIKAIKQGEASTTAEKVQALAFGSKGNENSVVSKGLQSALKTANTKVGNFDPAVVAQVKPIFDQVKAVGYGTDEADQLVADLSDNEYTVYKAMKAADIAQTNIDLEPKVLPIVQQAYKLGFGTDAADALIEPLTDEEYDAYKAVKSNLYGNSKDNPSADGTTSTQIAGKWDQQSFVDHVTNIAKAVGTDPVTAFNDIFAGNSSWKITGVTNGQVMVERLPLAESEAIKKQEGGDSSKYKLDHSISLEIGGNNGNDNLLLLPTGDKDTPGTWAWNSATENLLGKALKQGKITGKQAQEYMIRFKITAGEPLSDKYQKEFKDKYGSEPLTPDQIKQLVQ